MQSLTIDQLEVGQKARFSKTVTESDIASFAGLSGDFNPVHVDAEFAKNSIFGARVAHGPITLALIAGILGTQLPGVGTIAISNQVNYRKPVFIGDTVTAEVEVAEIERDRNRVRMSFTWTNQDGKVVADGGGEFMPPKEPAI